MNICSKIESENDDEKKGSQHISGDYCSLFDNKPVSKAQYQNICRNMSSSHNHFYSPAQEKLLTDQNGALQKLMEAEKEKNNTLLNMQEQQNGASTSSASPPPATVPDSMPTLNIGPCQPNGTGGESEPEPSPAQTNSGKLPPWMLRTVSNR
ncbi:hypothetical protein EJB05_11377, partial [Eragrostis curvula]